MVDIARNEVTRQSLGAEDQGKPGGRFTAFAISDLATLETFDGVCPERRRWTFIDSLVEAGG